MTEIAIPESWDGKVAALADAIMFCENERMAYQAVGVMAKTEYPDWLYRRLLSQNIDEGLKRIWLIGLSVHRDDRTRLVSEASFDV